MNLETIFFGILLSFITAACDPKAPVSSSPENGVLEFQFVRDSFPVNRDTVAQICIVGEPSTWALTLTLKKEFQSTFSDLTRKYVNEKLVLTNGRETKSTAIIMEPLSGVGPMAIMGFDSEQEARATLKNYFQMEESQDCD